MRWESVPRIISDIHLHLKPDLIRKIRNLGHEIGYHYEVLSKTKGDYTKAITLFQTELEEFRKICPVNTICMHGSPLSKYNNRDLWTRYDYHSYGISGEAFLSFEQTRDDFHYLTDTGRTWSGKRSLRDVMKTTSAHDDPVSLDSTDDLIKWIRYTGGKNSTSPHIPSGGQRISVNGLSGRFWISV